MADPESEHAESGHAIDSRTEQQRREDSRRDDPQPVAQESGTFSPGACRECGSPRLTLVSETDMVAIYKCPTCGHLSAPVKQR